MQVSLFDLVCLHRKSLVNKGQSFPVNNVSRNGDERGERFRTDFWIFDYRL